MKFVEVRFFWVPKIHIFGVAIDVACGDNRSKSLEVAFGGLIGGVSVNADSRRSLGVAGGLEAICGSVASGVSTAFGAGVFGIRSANTQRHEGE